MKKILIIIALFLIFTINSLGRIVYLCEYTDIYITTLNRNITHLTFKIPKREGNYYLYLQQDEEGNRRVIFLNNIKWVGNKIPSLTKRPKAIDVFCFYYIDGIYYAIATLDWLEP